MRPARSLTLAASLLGLAACSGVDADRRTALDQTFVGAWTVVHAWPAGAVLGAPAPEGQTVAITPTMAADPLGRRCAEPTYTVAPGQVTTALGIDAASSDRGLVLDVTCTGRPFTRYVAEGGRLLSTADGWLFELRPAGAVAVSQPAPAPAPAPVAMPAPAAPAVVAAPPHATPAHATPRTPVKHAAKPAPRTLGGETLYLASYHSQESAVAGWKVLQGKAAALKDLQPAYKEVDLGAKGRFVRLYATGATADSQARVCAALGKASPDCGARY
jgi:hypothetical protein